MNHRVFGRKLHRNKRERAQLFKTLVYHFVLHGRLVSTEGKVKAVRPLLEKLVTKAKRGETQRALLLKEIGNKEIVNKLLENAKTFSEVPGGYTKVIKLEARVGDNGKQLLMVWSREIAEEKKAEVVESPAVLPKPKKTNKKA